MTVDANGARGGNLNRMLVYSLPNSQTRREQCRHGNFTLTQFLHRQGLATGAAWRFDYPAHGRDLATVASPTANLAQSVLQHAEDTVAMADTVLVGMQDRLQV